MNPEELIPHLFRNEYRKIISVLCKRFGLHSIEIAEDIAGETFLAAAQTWGLNGIPGKPVAWLYQVARNKTINYLKRERIYDNAIDPETVMGRSTHPIDSGLNQSQEIHQKVDLGLDLSESNIIDSQLQMMFALCDPSIQKEAQIALILRLLCGFGIEQIAAALVSTSDAINKRLYRARKSLKEANITLTSPPLDEIPLKIETVLRTIYLLFNEGYYSHTNDSTIRQDLCVEAMRLCAMITEIREISFPAAYALLALMCFQSSRFEARVGDQGEMILYEDQDTNLWNQELIQKGAFYLHKSNKGESVSKYHLEATIAYFHTKKNKSSEEWKTILEMYDRLLVLDPSPIVALNRIYAIGKVHGPMKAIEECKTLCEDSNKVNKANNHLFQLLLGELYSHIDKTESQNHLENALSVAKNENDRKFIQKKIDRNA